jgi:FemAB-related protein (PEP-CTERM system-associated)
VIEIRKSATCAEWDAYVDRAPRATLYHASAWTEIVQSAYRVRAFRVISREAPGAPIRGVLPLLVIPRPFGSYVTTGPFGAYGPVLADDGVASTELFDAARAITAFSGARYLHVKSLDDGPPPDGFARQDVWVRATLPLDGGPGAVWSKMRKGARAAVRQANRSGFVARRGHDQLEPFYDVLAENMHRRGSPIYGMAFFQRVLEAFGERASVLTLHEGGRAVAGALTIVCRGVVYVPFASSRASCFPLRPNNRLYWEIIESACASGRHTLDFGSSIRGTSSLAFKRHFGARVEPIASYVYARTRATREPDLGPTSPRVQRAVQLWKKLPRGVVDAIGPWVCRFML